MLPALFSCMPFAKKPRFAGDPWAMQPHSPSWIWFHVEPCRKGSWITKPVDRQPWPDFIEWFEKPRATPPAQKELFQ